MEDMEESVVPERCFCAVLKAASYDYSMIHSRSLYKKIAGGTMECRELSLF